MGFDNEAKWFVVVEVRQLPMPLHLLHDRHRERKSVVVVVAAAVVVVTAAAAVAAPYW